MVDMRRRVEDRRYGITTEPTRLFFFSVSEHGCERTGEGSAAKGRGLPNQVKKEETHQSDDAVMFLHFLPEVLEARDQAVV